MPEGNSQARAKFMRELGAEVILVPQVDGAQGRVTGNDIRAAVGTAMEIVSERRGYYVDQFNNEGSVMAHFNGTGPEIWRDTNGQIDAFVSVVGSAGTFVGTARYLKGKNPAIRCVAVEPFGMEILAGGAMTKTSHVIQGTGYGLVPPHWDPALADDFISITDEEAGEYKDMLCRNEGLYTGFSAAANVCACVKFLRKKEHPADYKVVTLLCDTGFKY
jgi:cysteine synthase A